MINISIRSIPYHCSAFSACSCFLFSFFQTFNSFCMLSISSYEQRNTRIKNGSKIVSAEGMCEKKNSVDKNKIQMKKYIQQIQKIDNFL